MALALDDEHIFAAGGGQVIGNAGADNAAANNDRLCSMHQGILVDALG